MKALNKSKNSVDLNQNNAEVLNGDTGSKNKKSDKKGKRSGLIGCLAGGCVVLIILVVGIVLGGWSWPVVKGWMEDHNFINVELDEVESESSSTGSRKIISEENYVIDVVDSVNPGVVSVALAQVNFDPEQGVMEGSTNIGTGFIIDDSGLIMTNQHVVSSMTEDYMVVTAEGDEFEVSAVYRDDVNDLAILEIDPGDNDLEALTLGNSDELKVGQFVIAIGTPLGDFPGSVTTGIVSGLGRKVTASSGGFWSTSKVYEGVIQTDTAINPGNSGGPLLDTNGNVIGINFATTSGADNISFALPINLAKERISEFQEYGRFIKPYLGVEYQLISQTQAMQFSNVVAGALVTRVVADSPASDSGLQRLDIITELEGERISSSFAALIQKHAVGDQVEMKVWRNGEYITLNAVLKEME